MKNNRPQGLISDGISMMQKGHLESASAIFEKAIVYEENALCAQFLNASCFILSTDGTDSNKLKKSYLEDAIDTADKALAKLRDELDSVEQSEDTDSDF